MPRIRPDKRSCVRSLTHSPGAVIHSAMVAAWPTTVTTQVATDTIDYVATDTDGLAATSRRTVIIEAVVTATSR
jgi:hypothetical protein